jgi:Tfp pilus assembly protein PilF
MRTLAVVLAVGVICLISGVYVGSAACHSARVAGAHAALERATPAMTAGRRDEALEFALAALDRDPKLYAAYELAGDAVGAQQRNELPRHFYRAALGGAGPRERARIEAKIAALGEQR